MLECWTPATRLSAEPTRGLTLSSPVLATNTQPQWVQAIAPSFAQSSSAASVPSYHFEGQSPILPYSEVHPAPEANDVRLRRQLLAFRALYELSSEPMLGIFRDFKSVLVRLRCFRSVEQIARKELAGVQVLYGDNDNYTEISLPDFGHFLSYLDHCDILLNMMVEAFDSNFRPIFGGTGHLALSAPLVLLEWLQEVLQEVLERMNDLENTLVRVRDLLLRGTGKRRFQR